VELPKLKILLFEWKIANSYINFDVDKYKTSFLNNSSVDHQVVQAKFN
jgi:hypothetical protein